MTVIYAHVNGAAQQLFSQTNGDWRKIKLVIFTYLIKKNLFIIRAVDMWIAGVPSKHGFIQTAD